MRISSAFLIAIPLFSASVALAEGPSALEQKRDAKLAEPWLKQCPWFTDFDKARAEAKATGKTVFAYFTRSYAH